MQELPTGTVTMLFSDIEGSTALLGRLGDRYGEALAAQRAVMRAAISASGGSLRPAQSLRRVRPGTRVDAAVRGGENHGPFGGKCS